MCSDLDVYYEVVYIIIHRKLSLDGNPRHVTTNSWSLGYKHQHLQFHIMETRPDTYNHFLYDQVPVLGCRQGDLEYRWLQGECLTA